MRVIHLSKDGKYLSNPEQVVLDFLQIERRCKSCASIVVIESFKQWSHNQFRMDSDDRERSFNPYTSDDFFWYCPVCHFRNDEMPDTAVLRVIKHYLISQKEAARLSERKINDEARKKLDEDKRKYEEKEDRDVLRFWTIIAGIFAVIVLAALLYVW